MEHKHTQHVRSHSCLRRETSSVSPERHHSAGKGFRDRGKYTREISFRNGSPTSRNSLDAWSYWAVPGFWSRSWQVIIRFYIRNHCRLMSACTHTPSLPRPHPIRTHLQPQEGTLGLFSKLVIVSAGSRKELEHPVDLPEFVSSLYSYNTVCFLK